MERHYNIQEVFNLIGEENLKLNKMPFGRESKADIHVDGFNVHKFSLRYMTFFQKGTTCACCGKEGTYFTLDLASEATEESNRRHFNLRAEDGTLMTRDHILPKSLGGAETVENMQTYCVDCNKAKGNTYSGLEYIVAINKCNGQEKLFAQEEKAAHFLLTQTDVFMKGVKKVNEATKQAIKITLKLHSAIENEEEYFGYKWKKEIR